MTIGIVECYVYILKCYIKVLSNHLNLSTLSNVTLLTENRPEYEPFDWDFGSIFSNLDAKIRFTHDILNAFEAFPAEARLNCDDFFSLLSLVCNGIPYNFVVFVCECADPSISSKTILFHRIQFGNFLLALPVCIIYPYFMYELLTLFKTTDTLKTGIISKEKFLILINHIFERFLPAPVNPKDRSGKPPPEPADQLLKEFNGNERRYPSPDLVKHYEEATKELSNSSVLTLLFVIWQKDDILLVCKDRAPPRYKNIEESLSKTPYVNEYLPDDTPPISNNHTNYQESQQREEEDDLQYDDRNTQEGPGDN